MAESVAVVLARFKRGVSKLLSEPREWFVLVGDRLVVAGLVTSAFALCVLALAVTGVFAVENPSHMIYLFQVLVGGNLTLITIVLSINQLVLSREFNTPGELDARIENAIAYRDRVSATTHRDAVPVTPADFLLVLLDGTRESAQRLGGVAEGSGNDRFREEADALVTQLRDHTDHANDVLENSQDGVFSALAVVLRTNYSHQLREARRLRTAYEDELASESHEVLDELIESLKQMDIARQYFKSIYVQSELSRLSRILLYVGLPSVGGALLTFLVYVGGPGPVTTANYTLPLALAAVTLGFAPLAVLFSFVVRIAMVAQHTVAITPFTTPTQESDEETDR